MFLFTLPATCCGITLLNLKVVLVSPLLQLHKLPACDTTITKSMNYQLLWSINLKKQNFKLKWIYFWRKAVLANSINGTPSDRFGISTARDSLCDVRCVCEWIYVCMYRCWSYICSSNDDIYAGILCIEFRAKSWKMKRRKRHLSILLQILTITNTPWSYRNSSSRVAVAMLIIIMINNVCVRFFYFISIFYITQLKVKEVTHENEKENEPRKREMI